MSPAPSPAGKRALDRAAWRARVDRDLRGKDYARALVRHTLDGIAIEPLSDEATTPTGHDPAGWPGAAPFTRGVEAAPPADGWDLRAWVRASDPAQAATHIAEAAALGATSARVSLDPTGAAGVSFQDTDALAPLWAAAPAGFGFDLVGARLRPDHWRRLARVVPQASLGVDPLGALAHVGDPADPLAEMVALADLVARASAPCARVRTAPIHDAGGSPAQALGWALACGAAWLRGLLAAGLPLPSASAAIRLDLAVGTELFAEIAKVRAARLTWSRLTAAVGAPQPLRITGIEAGFHLTRHDPWVNLLRGTAAATAAVLGGANAVVVRPYDSAAGAGAASGRRLALTTQLLLRDESQLHRLADPAGGAWAIEQHTADLSAAAWCELQAIEAAGGPFEALRSGWIRARIDRVWAETERGLRTRRQAITGVSTFPAPTLETGPGRAPVDPPSSAAHPAARLPTRSRAGAWEALRDAADAAAATGQRPSVALVTLGPLRDRSARTSWIENLLAAGGLAIIERPADTPTGPTAPEPAVVLCGSDAALADAGPALARRFSQSGATVAVSGRMPDPLRAAGATVALAQGADVYAALVELLRAAGVEVSP